MIETMTAWYRKLRNDPDSLTLVGLIFVISLIFYFFSEILAPVLVAIVLAYLLDWPVNKLLKLNIHRVIAVSLVLLIFSGTTILVSLVLIPTLWQQGINLIDELPQILSQIKAYLMSLPESYPDYVNVQQIEEMLIAANEQLLAWGQGLLSASLNSLFSFAALLIYLVLVPLMVFFMLNDKHQLLRDISKMLPSSRRLVNQVWNEFNAQVINYIRGKFIEILIVGGVSVITFLILDLRYAVLLGVLVGLSVLIPYIGAAVVTIPVCVVALFQWGLATEFWYVFIAYAIIQTLDGNVLVPLLFSEAVNLHPLMIIVAVLFFGGVWGFWGVFFAIPLATLVKALSNAWIDNKELAQD